MSKSKISAGFTFVPFVPRTVPNAQETLKKFRRMNSNEANPRNRPASPCSPEAHASPGIISHKGSLPGPQATSCRARPGSARKPGDLCEDAVVISVPWPPQPGPTKWAQVTGASVPIPPSPPKYPRVPVPTPCPCLTPTPPCALRPPSTHSVTACPQLPSE